MLTILFQSCRIKAKGRLSHRITKGKEDMKKEIKDYERFIKHFKATLVILKRNRAYARAAVSSEIMKIYADALDFAVKLLEADIADFEEGEEDE